jgi:hypothetical protein
MSMKQLMEYAIESGEIAAEPEVIGATAEETLTDVLLDEAAASGDDTLAEHLEQADESQDIAEQLEELADRTECLAADQEENPPSEDVIAVSVESAHREFRAIMRANRLPFVAASFEAKESGNALKDIAADARRVQRIAEGHRVQLMDLSAEGAISRFLNRDESKIAKGINALAAAEASLSGSFQALKDHPVIIDHNGVSAFMTQGGEHVMNLKQGVANDSAHLMHVHDTVAKSLSVILALATGLKSSGGTLGTSVSKVLGGNFLGDLSGVATKGPSLMGNYAFDVDGAVVHGIPKLKRSRDVSKDSRTSTAGIVAGIVIGAVLGSAIPVAGTLVGAAVGATVAKNAGERSEVKSAAGAGDLVAAIQMVKNLNKVTDYKINTDAIDVALKAARASTGDLTAEEKSKTKEAASALESAISRLVQIADCAYEQAFYDITTMASLVSSVAKAAKRQSDQ